MVEENLNFILDLSLRHTNNFYVPYRKVACHEDNENTK